MFLLLLVSVAAFGQVKNDWLIVPGERVGPIHADMTRTQVAEVFGAKNLKDGITSDEEGNYRIVIAFPQDPARQLQLEFDQHSHKLGLITVCPTTVTGCRWHTMQGITTGTSLKELEYLNGRPFHLAGFAWDYSGTVTNWNHGTLTHSLASQHPCRKDEIGVGLALNVAKQDSKLSDQEREWISQTSGDADWLSSARQMRGLNPVVTGMFVRLICNFDRDYVGE